MHPGSGNNIALAVFGEQATRSSSHGAAFNSDVSEAAAAYPALWLPGHLLEYVGQVFYSIFFLTFPDGRFVPSWTRWLALVWAMLFVPLPLREGAHPRAPSADQVGGLRDGGGGGRACRDEHAGHLRSGDRATWSVRMIGETLYEGFVLLIPLSMGVANVHSGLYEIDVIINRTQVCGPLTAMLVALYFGSDICMNRSTKPAESYAALPQA